MILAKTSVQMAPLAPDLPNANVSSIAGGFFATFGAVGGATRYGIEATNTSTGITHSTGPKTEAQCAGEMALELQILGLSAVNHDVSVIACDNANDIAPNTDDY